jgi:ankyrin repeat protein
MGQLYELPFVSNLFYQAFHTACLRGRLDIVHLLVARKVNIDIRDSFGTTPLHGSCVDSNSSSVTYFLLTRGANVNAIDQVL